jgi:hypothetical protein
MNDAARCRAVNATDRRCRYRGTHKGRHAPPDSPKSEFMQCSRMRCHGAALADESECLSCYRDDDEHVDEWSMSGVFVLNQGTS